MKIMGILNVTPDSFSDGGQYIDVDKAVAHALQMVQDSADIIDVGGESTRPGAKPVSIDDELQRVIPVIQRLAKEITVPISIDTYKAEVARQAVASGATIINDVTGAKFDPEMPQVMADGGAKVILMHNRPHGQENDSSDIFAEVISQLQSSIDLILQAGVKKENIIVDPGIGFGKTFEQNVELIKNIHHLKTMGYPVMLAASKKRTIRALTQHDDPISLSIGTIATTCYAYNKGIDYVRVHDVKENKVALDVMKHLNI